MPSKRDAVAERLHSVSIHLLRRLREADTESGLGPARLSLLSVLVFGGPKTLGELAAAEQVTAPTMSRLVQAMERDSLVARSSSPNDKRSVLLQATRKGEKTMLRARAARLERFATLLDRVAPTELKTLQEAGEILTRLLS